MYEKVREAALGLYRKGLIRFDQTSEALFPLDMGRVASNYYINVDTMSYFMASLKP